MKSFFFQLSLICLSVFFFVGIAFSQKPVPTARPLPTEFFKRRDAGNAFEFGRLFLQKRTQESYQKATEYFQKSAEIYGELGDKANVGCALLGIGLTQNWQGKQTESIWTYNRALAIFRNFKGEKINSKALAQLGFLYDSMVGKRKPFEYKSLEIQPPKKGFDQDGNKIDYRFSQTSFRYYLQYFNQPFIFFVNPYKPGEDIFDDPRFAGYSEYPEPVSFVNEIQEIWKLNGFESLEVATNINLMETWADSNRQLSIFFGKQAINKYQEIRKNLKEKNPRDVLRYFNLMPNKFRFLADLLIANGQFAEAEQVLQMLKKEEFSEFIKRDADEIKDLNQRVALNEKERELIKRYSEFADKVAEIGQEFLTLDDKKRKLADQKQMLSSDEQSRYEQLSAQIKDANDSFKLFIEKDLNKELSVNATKTIEIDRDMQEKLRRRGDGTVAIYTVITENRYRVFLTTPTVQVDGKTEIKAEELNKKIFEFRDALQNKKIDPRILGKEIYDILLKPIEKELKASNAKTLVWSLDGVLRYIPLAAISPDGKTYLVEQYQNVLLTSKTREDLPNPNIEWRALGMGVSEEQEITYPEMPNEVMVMNSIPAVKNELLAIIQDENNPKETGIFKGKRFLDEEFTLANLEKSLAIKSANGKKKFNVVHFASHFRLGGNWSESFLLLGNSKILTLENFANMPTMNFNEVELVTLSACKTGISSEPNGKEIESLAGAIQAKGGRTVLATLWDVVDESTSLLMSNFYRLKKENPNMTKAEALQLAQKELINGNIRNGKPRFAHPYYWSPFVIFGNWR
jgi:CHAT domain-containing protein